MTSSEFADPVSRAEPNDTRDAPGRCFGAWVTPTEVQVATRTADGFGVSPPSPAHFVPHTAYADFAPDPAWATAGVSYQPRLGTYVVRLDTDPVSGERGWELIGRLAP